MSTFLAYLAVLLLVSKVFSEDFQKVYIRSVRCNCSGEYVFRNYSCYAKSYSRTRSTVNIYIVNKNLTSDFHVLMRMSFKYGTIYREVMHSPKFDWCELMDEKQTNPMILQIMTVFKDSFPDLIHRCPFQGIDISNSTIMTASMASVFPTGDYIFHLFFFKTASVDYYATIKVMMSMLTSNKDTFG